MGNTGAGGPLSDSDTVAINVVDQAPTDIVFTGNDNLSANAVNIGTHTHPNYVTEVSNHSTLFTASAVDPDDSSGFHYSFNGGGDTQSVTVGGSSETFTIDPNSGALTTTKLDYTTVQDIQLTLQTTDSLGASHQETVNLWLGLDNANDTIDGSAVANDQVIYGFGGNDTLTGGSGNDWISGGQGNDTLKGGAGADTFAFADTGPANVDTIVDYNAGQGDILDLSALLDAHFHSNSDVNDFVRLTDSGNDVKVQVDLDGASHGANWVDVAVLSGYHTVGNQVLAEFENQVHQLTVTA
jgi:Ca2+-binding RTX toxin-like protein